MTKGKSTQTSKELTKIKKISKLSKPKEEVKEFINSRGFKSKLHPIPPYLLQIVTESIEHPVPPKYVVETADGTQEEVYHDETSILDPKTSKEEKDQWEKFLKESVEADQASSNAMLNLILLESVEVPFSQIEKEAWIKKLKLIGISPPEDPEEQLLMYKKMTVLSDTDDIQNIITKVLELTMVSREEVESVKDSFQDSVESGTSTKSGKKTEGSA